MRVENPGDGLAQIFAKIPGGGGAGVKAFRTKLPGGSPLLGFIAFLLASLLKFAWGSNDYPSPLTPPPSCTSMSSKLHQYNYSFIYK